MTLPLLILVIGIIIDVFVLPDELTHSLLGRNANPSDFSAGQSTVPQSVVRHLGPK